MCTLSQPYVAQGTPPEWRDLVSLPETGHAGRGRASGLATMSRPGRQLSTFILRGRPSPRAVCTLWPPSARGRLPGNVSSWSSPPGPPLPAPNRCGVTQHRQLLDTAWRPLSSPPWLREGLRIPGESGRRGWGSSARGLDPPSLPLLSPKQGFQHLPLLFGGHRGGGSPGRGLGLPFVHTGLGPGVWMVPVPRDEAGSPGCPGCPVFLGVGHCNRILCPHP